MRDSDTILLEDIYTNQILLNEAAPRQRSRIQGAWDRMAGGPLEHPTSMARNNLMDVYRDVWEALENDWEANNATSRNSPIPITLDYLADFLKRNYPQINTSQIVDPLALEYSRNGNLSYTDELDEQISGDFLYDALADYYESIGGINKTNANLPNAQSTQQTNNPPPSPNQQPSQNQPPSSNQQPNNQTQPNTTPNTPTAPQPTTPTNNKKTKLPSSKSREMFSDEKKKPSLWKRYKNFAKNQAKTGYSDAAKRSKSQIVHT